jgi:hypothetical protein
MCIYGNLSEKVKKSKKTFFTFVTFSPIWSSYLYPEVAKTTLNRLVHVYSCFSIIKSQKIEKNFFHFFHLFTNLVILPVPESGQNYFLPAFTSPESIKEKKKFFKKNLKTPPPLDRFLAPFLHPHDLKK